MRSNVTAEWLAVLIIWEVLDSIQTEVLVVFFSTFWKMAVYHGWPGNTGCKRPKLSPLTGDASW
jgi:hypothetical protein